MGFLQLSRILNQSLPNSVRYYRHLIPNLQQKNTLRQFSTGKHVNEKSNVSYLIW